MAISLRRAPTRGHLINIFIGATILAAVAAVLPIAAAVVTGSRPPLAHTAFASAPAGNYAIVSRPEAKEDVIAIVPAAGGDPVEVARVSHLPGFTSSGAVSPEGGRVALVTVDDGSPARPLASLVVLDLASGATHRLASDLDQLQSPIWAPDGRSVVVTRTVDDGTGHKSVRVLRVSADSGDSTALYEVKAALGAYPIGFEPGGALVGVTIDGAGSHATRDGAEVVNFSTQITRDWRLSPDGHQLAFVESNLSGGLRYVARTVALDGSGSRAVEAQSASTSQQLGAAWKPGSQSATFGSEPLASTRSTEVGATAASNSEALTVQGFDVPLAYSPDGATLAVTHWSGQSFKDPGEGTLQLIGDGGRMATGNFSRFFGWSAR